MPLLIRTADDLHTMVSFVASERCDFDTAREMFGPIDRWIRSSAHLAPSHHPDVAQAVLETHNDALAGVHLILRAQLELPKPAIEQRFGEAIHIFAEVDRYDGQTVHRFEPSTVGERGYILLHAWDEEAHLAIQELVVRPARSARSRTR